MRDSGQDHYENESADVREAVEAFEDWVSTLHVAARALKVTNHPLAGDVERLFQVASFEGGSAENVRGNGPTLVNNVEKLGDLSEVGLPPEFLAQGRALLERITTDRGEAWGARTERVTQTAVLNAALDEIVDLLERYARFREFAMAMSKVEIPDLSLTSIRASRGSSTADGPVTAPPMMATPPPAPIPDL